MTNLKLFLKGSGAGIPFWDFVGSTIVTNKMIRLTSDSQSLQGGLWNIVVRIFFVYFFLLEKKYFK